MSGAGSRHPLPASGEARHGEIPETDEAEKGRGDEGAEVVQPTRPVVDPDGRPYRAGLPDEDQRRDGLYPHGQASYGNSEGG